MILTRDNYQGELHIQSCKAAAIKINHQHYTASLIITPNRLISNWYPVSSQAIQEVDLDLIYQQKPDIVLLGTGMIQDLVLSPLLAKRRIGFEIMSTVAACRTFNALLAEGRHVVAGLIIEQIQTNDTK
jgi:uncharacterized protein